MIPIYKSDNEIEANVLLSLLRANDILCKLGKFRQGIKGSAYKEYSIWVEEESEEEAKRLIASREDNSPFANMPWDPDSDNTDPEPKRPWYLDSKKRNRIGRVIFYISIAIIVFWCIYTS